MKRIYFIYNLVSGKATLRSHLAHVIDLCTKAGYEVTCRSTQARHDASAAAEYACLQKYDMILCSGGDGTLNEVIQGIMLSGVKDIPLGYIPTGSTNDFSRGLGVPPTIDAAANWTLSGERFACDIGQFNGRNFIYVAAFGAFVDVTYETSQNVKNILGHGAYLLNGLSKLKTIRAYQMKIEYDDNVIEGEFIFGMVTNTSSVAGILSLNDFQLDDGLFEVALIYKPQSIVDLQRLVSSLLNLKQDVDTKSLNTFRASSVKFTAENEVSWTVDGEDGGTLKYAEVNNLNKAITFAVGKHKYKPA